MYPRDVKITISQYSPDEDELLDTFTFTFDELVKYVVNYQKYYWRIELFGKTKKRVAGEHFGCSVSSVGSLYLREADYLNAFLNYMIKHYYNNKMKNTGFPINLWNFWALVHHDNVFLDRMAACNKNDRNVFERLFNKYLSELNLYQEIYDLNLLSEVQGIYCLVLDNYNVCYVGQSKNMKQRILSHWRDGNYSSCGIDMFKAMDTTRVYAFATDKSAEGLLDKAEIISVDPIFGDYCLNYFPGGSFDNMWKLERDLDKLKQRSNSGGMNVFHFYKLTKMDDPEAIGRIQRFALE